jgi:hypothetical protein
MIRSGEGLFGIKELGDGAHNVTMAGSYDSDS